MNSAQQPTVLVGVDGSVASRAALSWAADEARQRHARLRIISAWEPEFRAPYAPADCPSADEQRSAAGAELAAAMRAAFGSACPAGVTAELTRGNAERTLVDRSADADLLVLGSGPPPGSAGRLIGPVIQTCLSHAGCPVVVVSRPGHPGSPAGSS
jgi:nucleotide-binding universal stress UspA family protein